MRKVLVVDDNVPLAENLAEIVTDSDLGDAVIADSGGRALELLKEGDRFDVMITDMRMPGTSGMELHQKLVAGGHAIPTILITAYPDETVRARAVRAGIRCYLPKPVTSDALLACVDEALGAR